ncbi:protein Tube [Stomoxys calcitrans]|uniref:Death domain-containing protein n=1 Tax=Stomoxys calcitrans TaxID=35570 RepID=A0A1I8NYH6_STOCA|nr:protein Tube [Stomoxys calcitrans]
MSTYCRDTELRNVQTNDLYKLAVILDDNDYWKKLMEAIPKDINNKTFGSPLHPIFDDNGGRKYSNDHIRLIQNAFKRTGESRLCPQILFDEWGSSGRKNERPTLGVLLNLLLKAQLFRAADFVAENFLGEPKPPRPTDGPGAEITCELPSTIYEDICEMANDSQNYPGTELILQNANFGNSLMDNNKDYYTKYRDPIEKIFAPAFASANDNGVAPKPPPRLHKSVKHLEKQKQSQKKKANHTYVPHTNLFDETAKITNHHNIFTINEYEPPPQELSSLVTPAMPSDNLPKISLLLESTNSKLGNSLMSSEDSTPKLSFLIGNSIRLSDTSEEIRNCTDSAPNIEYKARDDLNSTFSDIPHSKQHSHDLPAISALNLNGERDPLSYSNSIKNVPSVALNFKASSQDTDEHVHISSATKGKNSDTHIDTDIGAVGNIVDDSDNSEVDEDNDVDVYIEDDDADVPNLSIFNDSSLTSVTNTSGENSFEQNNDSRPTSTDNMLPLTTEGIPITN